MCHSTKLLADKLEYSDKPVFVFDLDGVLAESKAPLSSEMALLLEKLLRIKKVAIISGASLKQFMKQVVSHLTLGYENLYLLPTCGSRMYTYKNGQWTPVFQNLLVEAEKTKIIAALNEALISYGHNPQTTHGPMIEDRETQITFSALGQEAPLEHKEKWDPDQRKRQAIKKLLDSKIPEFEVRLGGTTSIDVTRKGIDKAFGVGKFMELYGYKLSDILFVGDALYPGGNDRPVKDMNIQCEEVKSPEDTKKLIKFLLNKHLTERS
jgi:phosphomannomutase